MEHCPHSKTRIQEKTLNPMIKIQIKEADPAGTNQIKVAQQVEAQQLAAQQLAVQQLAVQQLAEEQLLTPEAQLQAVPQLDLAPVVPLPAAQLVVAAQAESTLPTLTATGGDFEIYCFLILFS